MTDISQATTIAYERFLQLADALAFEDLARPVPSCPRWTVEDLLRHLASNTEQIGVGLAGGTPQWGAPIEGDAATSIAVAHAANGRLTREPAALEREIMPGVRMVDMNLLEVCGHTWDLASVLGEPVGLPDGCVNEALAAYARLPIDSMRGDNFGPRVEVPVDGPAIDRLAGLMGRTPGAA